MFYLAISKETRGALKKTFSGHGWIVMDFAKIGISCIFRDFRALLWGFEMPAGG